MDSTRFAEHGPSDERPRGDFREVVPVGAEGTLFVDLDFGSVSVRTHDEELVSISAEVGRRLASRTHFRVEREGGDVCLFGTVDDWLPGLLGGARIKVRVSVPRGFALDLHSGAGAIRTRGTGGRVAADSSGGLIEIDGARGPVLVSTGGGAARVRKVETDVRARTAGGLVDVRDVAGAVEASTVGGPVRVQRARGRVDARTGAGPIVVDWVGAPAGTLKTSAGPIDVRLPSDAGVEIDARCGAGGVHISRSLPFAGERRSSYAAGRIGAGGQTLVLRSAAGGVRIRTRDP